MNYKFPRVQIVHIFTNYCSVHSQFKMKIVLRNSIIFYFITLSILFQFCSPDRSEPNTRILKSIRNKTHSEKVAYNNPTSNEKGNQNNYFNYGISKRVPRNFKCRSISCISLKYLDKRLQHLKNKLLYYYDKKTRDLASSRDGHGNGIGFPSLEGALLSLAFLTFAVFLIDLLQQLLSRVRTGSMMPVNPPVMAAGRRRRALFVDHLRDMDSTTAISSVVSSIENPRFLERM